MGKAFIMLESLIYHTTASFCKTKIKMAREQTRENERKTEKTRAFKLQIKFFKKSVDFYLFWLYNYSRCKMFIQTN
jgi:hypothetical protein